VLTSLEGLDGLLSIGDEVVIYSNAALSSLDGPDRLTTIGGNLRIGCGPEFDWSARCEGNPVLSSVHGLAALRSIGAHLIIGGNPMLPTCEARGLLEQLRFWGWGGSAQWSETDDAGSCE